MKEGWWLNYETKQCFEIDEHERWVRRGLNALHLGISSKLRKTFDDYEQAKERDAFLN